MPLTPIVPIVIGDVTSEALDGTGNFDILMRTVGLHIDKEYTKGRIKGVEYSTVYLGALNAVLDKAMAFTMEVDKSWLEAEILRLEFEKLELEKLKVAAETNLINAQVGLITQQTANAVIEATVLVAQECKLRAEYNVLIEQKLKTVQETALMAQKVATELAQTNGASVTEDSILGKQRALYAAQTAGFARDAEHKIMKAFMDIWNVQRGTDETTLANTDNGLQDANILRAVNKALTGIGA